MLFVGLHRAGLMDGWVYSHALPRRTVFMVAAARLRRPWMRLLVTGIGVARRQDGGGPEGNRAALAACGRELATGGTVFVFPEGTSSLAPGHLPFQPGAALLAQSCPAAAIVPLAIRYAAPTRIGTAADVVVGAPFHLPAGTTRLTAQARITAALEAVDAVRPVSAPVRNPFRWPAAGRNPPPGAAVGLAARAVAPGGKVGRVWAALAGQPVQCLWSPIAIGWLLVAGMPWVAAAYAGATALYVAWPMRAYHHA